MGKLRRIRPPADSSDPDWLGKFELALRRSGLTRLTVRSYHGGGRIFARWLKSVGQTLEYLQPSDLLAFRQHLTNAEGKKAATVNQRLQAVRWLCAWAHRGGALKTNPATEVKTVRVATRRRPLGLPTTEVHRLFRAAGVSRPSQRTRNYAVLQLLLQAGLRVGEVVRLRVSDVTLHDRSGQVRVREGKGGKEREVPLNISVRRAIRVYLAGRPGAKGEEALFLSQKARALSARSIEALVVQLARQAKIERRVTPHTLRHTFALAYLKDHPGKLVDLASLLGHESLDTTAVYTQPSEEELAADLERSHLNVF